MKLFIALLLFCTAAVAQNAHKAGGADYAPDEWLLASRGQPWWYQTKPSPQPKTLSQRDLSSQEQRVINQARDLLTSRPARAIALIDGENVAYVGFNGPADQNSILFGFSMGKTVTSMAIGQAICDGSLKMETTAAEVLPELRGKPLGRATVRDLLTMTSGAADPNADSTIWTAEQFKRWGRGELTILESVTEERVSKAERGVFKEYKPGEHFSYKSTDPMVLGMMISRTTGMPYSHWVQAKILDPMGATRGGLVVQDKTQDGATDAGIRLRMEDWIKFAQWVKKTSKGSDCMANYVKSAMKTQQKNSGDRGRDFAGYGYLMWTEPQGYSGTAWAFGHGGQLIGWDLNSDRMVIVFSNIDNWKVDVFSLLNDWRKQ